MPVPPVPPLIVPLLVSVAIVPAFATPAPPAPPLPELPSRAPPPLIAPLLVSVVIVPELDTPAPPGRSAERPACARAAVDRAAVGQGRDRPGVGTPAPPALSRSCVAAADRAPAALVSDPIVVPAYSTRPRRHSTPPPPLIAPLLVSVLIVPEFDTPAPAGPQAGRPRRPRRLIVPLLVSVVIVPAFDTPAPPAPPALCRGRRSAADRAAVGQRS